MTTTFTYAIAVFQIVLGLVGLVTGWFSSQEAVTILMIGLGVFGIHKSNVAVGRAMGARI